MIDLAVVRDLARDHLRIATRLRDSWLDLDPRPLAQAQARQQRRIHSSCTPLDPLRRASIATATTAIVTADIDRNRLMQPRHQQRAGAASIDRQLQRAAAAIITTAAAATATESERETGMCLHPRPHRPFRFPLSIAIAIGIAHASLARASIESIAPRVAIVIALARALDQLRGHDCIQD